MTWLNRKKKKKKRAILYFFQKHISCLNKSNCFEDKTRIKLIKILVLF